MVSTWRAPPGRLDPEQTQEAVGVLEEGVSEGLEPCALGRAGACPSGSRLERGLPWLPEIVGPGHTASRVCPHTWLSQTPSGAAQQGL